MGEDSNHRFRVDTAVGLRLVVRMCLPDGRSDAELAELAGWRPWPRDTDLSVRWSA